MIRVLVVGSEGRLGAFACRTLEEETGFEIIGRVGSNDDLAAEARRAAASGAVAFEATRAGLGARHARVLLEAGVPTVVGTSGVTAEELVELERLAAERHVGVWVVPNFSRGAELLIELAERIRREFPSVELVETHHDQKHDRPSGTARAIQRALGGELPIHSLRLPDALATHELRFGREGESLRLEHRALGPKAYREGILETLREVGELGRLRIGWRSER